jgi:polyhydroxybutyrate depolymerase
VRAVPWGRAALVVVGLPLAQCRAVDIYAVTRDVDAGTGATAPEPSTTEPSTATTSEPTSTAPITASNASEATSSAAESGSTTATTETTSTGAPSCLPVDVTHGDTSVNVRVGSLTRSYVLHIPQTYDGTARAPLIIDFHGAGGDGWEQLMTSPYLAVTDPDGVVMVFPDGVNGPIGTAWNFGPCCVPGVDDLTFVEALLADVQQRTCIDATRIYAVGVLTGGGLVHQLACERSTTFAAVSPAAFDLVEETVETCTPEEPITVVAFRGTADAKVPYEGGSSALVPNMSVTFLGAQGSFERWAAINGCTSEASPPDVNGCSFYTGCEGATEVVLCTKQDGSGEPGNAPVAWPILKRHTR